MSTFHFSLTLVLSTCSAHWTGAIVPLSRFFRPTLELAFVGNSAFPSRICNPSTLAAGYMCPAAMLFVIQIMLIVKIQSVSSVQNLFLRQFFGVRHSICQCLLAAHIRLVFSVPSCRYYNIVLMFVYVFPPALLIVYVGFTELLYPFQILCALEDIFFFLLLPCGMFFSPYHSAITAVRLYFLPRPFFLFRPICAEILFCEYDPHHRHFF